ncbi:MAG: cupin domain-containing protein [Xanthomonadales bacterium]|nr:cupin domain-containing protein [Xanthomonadales bacterium]
MPAKKHWEPLIFKNTSLTREQFLADYWQKKPLLIRQALPGFAPELDSNDIAGLACDELAESRLITGSFPEQDWQVRYGPFTDKDFSKLPDARWTLLVQDVEKHYPPLQSLMSRFSFLPRWRIDDLMVSVAGPGGSVGPHVDQYDVFLLQAEGSRHWKISESYDGELLPDCELKVLRHFSAEQEWLLEPGDMLYLPPGVAHHGVAQDTGMTWSIGMRAPSAADLFLALGEWLAEKEDEGGRYRDPELSAALQYGEVDLAAINRFGDFLHSPVQGDREFRSFLGTFLSRYRLAHDPAAPASVLKPAALLKALNGGKKLRHNPWSRLLWIVDGQGARVFAAGAEYSCDVDFARTLCDPERLCRVDRSLPDSEVALLCEFLNRGHLYLEQL